MKNKQIITSFSIGNSLTTSYKSYYTRIIIIYNIIFLELT